MWRRQIPSWWAKTTRIRASAGSTGSIARYDRARADRFETGFDGNDPETIPYQSAPRSAIGVTADGNTLLLVTVDGWQVASIGMTAPEVAAFLKDRGAAMAMMLDSGGSSTLVIDKSLANHPSDGVQRPVANHLAIKQGNLGTGEVTGVVCKDDIIACREDRYGCPVR